MTSRVLLSVLALLLVAGALAAAWQLSAGGAPDPALGSAAGPLAARPSDPPAPPEKRERPAVPAAASPRTDARPQAPPSSPAPAFEASDAHQRLDSIAATFLGEVPDLAALLAWLDGLAGIASIPVGQVERSERLGQAQGPLVFTGANFEGAFRVRQGEVQVSISASGYYPAPLVQRDVSLGFRVRDGGLVERWIDVRYHPDANRSASRFLGSKQEQRAGWRVVFDGAQASGTAWTIGTGPGDVWRVGPSAKLPPLTSQAPTSAAFQRWRDALTDYLE